MPGCPYSELRGSSGGSSATAGDWEWTWSVSQNSAGERVTSALQRTVRPWLLEGLEDGMTFSCV